MVTAVGRPSLAAVAGGRGGPPHRLFMLYGRVTGPWL